MNLKAAVLSVQQPLYNSDSIIIVYGFVSLENDWHYSEKKCKAGKAINIRRYAREQ